MSSHVSCFESLSTLENLRIEDGATPADYEKYMKLLKAAADLADDKDEMSHAARLATRRVHQTMFEQAEDVQEQAEIYDNMYYGESENSWFNINATRQGRKYYGPGLSKGTFFSLPPDDRQVWDTLTPKARELIAEDF